MPKSYELIASNTVGSGGTSNITFSSIPQTYTDLLIKYSLRNTLAAVNDNINMTFNSSTSGYSDVVVIGGGSSASSFSRSSRSEVAYFYQNSANSTSNTFANGEIYIPNYAGTSANKSVSIDSVVENNATACVLALDSALLQNTAAIASITFNSNNGTFVQHGTIYLYGIIKS
jgi:hypothetical protein